MIKLRGTWTQIDPDETHWQCEYGSDGWDLSCGTCTISPDRSTAHGSKRMNRAHWYNNDGNYLCSVHYDMLTYKPPVVEPNLLSADEFASAFDTI